MFSPRGVAIAVAMTASLVLLSGCWNRSHRIQPPSALSYADLGSIVLQGIELEAKPEYRGDRATEFLVEPPLPAGLTLDPVSGRIHGTPLEITPTADHVITACNSGGEDELLITLTVNPQAPCDLSYSEEDALYVGLVTAVVNMPSVSCGPGHLWVIEPALPEGLTLDGETGIIAGVATELIARTEFTITASNVTGSTTRTIFLEVESPAPCGLSYAQENVVYPPSVPIHPNLPTSDCGAVELFTVTPALPSGLSLDPATGEISGTPAVEQGESVHTITASNSYGSDSTDLTLRISPVFQYIAGSAAAEFDPATGEGALQSTLRLLEGSDNATFPTPIIGLSFAIEHDSALLVPSDVLPGADLLTLGDGSGPDFFEPFFHDGAVTVGIVFSFDLMTLLMADSLREVLVIEYQTRPEAFLDGAEPVSTALTWGSPASSAVENEVALSGTYSVDPILIDATFLLTPAAPAPAEEQP